MATHWGQEGNCNKYWAMKEDILNQLEFFYKVMHEESIQGSPLALVVDGKALEIALKSDVKDQFLQLAVNCASVICCRVSPKQKALEVLKCDGGCTISTPSAFWFQADKLTVLKEVACFLFGIMENGDVLGSSMSLVYGNY